MCMVSVVIPCYYSEGMIAKVVDLTREQLVSGGYGYEFLLVNDGSSDGTFKVIEELCEEDPNVVGIDCAKNLGQHSAIMAGLKHAKGELVMLMDDDMQTHPSQCLKLLGAIDSSSCDVVFAEWPEHKEAWWRLLGSKFSEFTMRILTKRPKEIYASNFLVMRNFIRDELVKYTGPYVYIQGLLFRATSNMGNVTIEHFEREEGRSGYTLKTLIRLWSTVLNFSMMPLRMASVVGCAVGVSGIALALFIAARKLLEPGIQDGWTSIMAAMLICSGLIIMFLGLIGEYLGRLFMTANQAPQYVVRKIIDRREPRGF